MGTVCDFPWRALYSTLACILYTFKERKFNPGRNIFYLRTNVSISLVCKRTQTLVWVLR